MLVAQSADSSSQLKPLLKPAQALQAPSLAMAATRNILISYLMLFLAVGLVCAATATAADLPRRMLPAVAWRPGYSCCYAVCRGSCAPRLLLGRKLLCHTCAVLKHVTRIMLMRGVSLRAPSTLNAPPLSISRI